MVLDPAFAAGSAIELATEELPLLLDAGNDGLGEAPEVLGRDTGSEAEELAI